MMRAMLAKRAKVDPTTWPRIETLQFIADHPSPKMKDVAEHLSISAPSATALVNGLVTRGLVTHVTDIHDRRSIRLALTKKGRSELKRIITHGTRLLGELFSVLSPAELTRFVATLERLRGKEKA